MIKQTFFVASPAAFDTLCPYGHGALPGPGDAREGDPYSTDLIPKKMWLGFECILKTC